MAHRITTTSLDGRNPSEVLWLMAGNPLDVATNARALLNQRTFARKHIVDRLSKIATRYGLSIARST